MKITIKVEEIVSEANVIIVGERAVDARKFQGQAGKVMFVNLLNELTGKVKSSVAVEMQKRGLKPRASAEACQDTAPTASEVSNSTSPSSTCTERTTSPRLISSPDCEGTPGTAPVAG